ncbi:hypothetical protein ACEZDB_12060 [Streptacidiphilus sp. N1-3]|uniref:PASTA domain-containing protein n=1 Tax=Streptacidiphilus alkalitolerans TaxID=3342712 RepID=A0ABV6WZI9_9ACTN
MKKTLTALALALAPLALAAPAIADDGLQAMPQVTGQGLIAAIQALHYDQNVKIVDASGMARHVDWPADWKVCTQQPAAGNPLQDQQATLTVVKNTETCPA